MALRQELAAAREVAARASSTWDKFRKERDFHRMHHKRVAQEKNKLITDIKRLKVIIQLLASSSRRVGAMCSQPGYCSTLGLIEAAVAVCLKLPVLVTWL